jgi:amino acid transporter
MITQGESRRSSRISVALEEAGATTAQADRTLEDLGYTPELSRNRSVWQVTFMCFILSSVPYGLSTTLFYPLAGGGPANVIWGWVVVSCMIFCVALSLAEITSVFPTAGGVYYQTFVLSPVWCRRVASWICGWSYVAGNITITLAVNFGTTLFFVSCLNVFTDSTGTGITENFQPYQTFLIFLALTLLTHAISAFGNKWLPWLEVGLSAVPDGGGRVLTILDFCHLLDPGGTRRHCSLPACRGQERPQLRCMGVWPL